ncbi:TPM domain-containing protein [Ottowia testudinis]|uniref:TPM domain-containing protein n=1 Tax=Ottowia testudinis TaxID=2816950 RepID=A0A975CHJ3_9BURK|nr:TPM domain-containing protein [Ottowia testudinis]QTD45206.1 TPM domain-containing protein [Ottowia testudinis]
MRLAHVLKALAAIFFIAYSVLAAHAQPLLPVPPLTSHVIDTSGTLQPAAIAALDAKLATLERDKGSQVVVLMVPATAPEDIAAFANRVGNAWKIGRKDVGDGLIVLVAVKDRRMRIEVAKTLEGAIPDIAAKHIIDEAMAPHFRQGDYAAGLDAAIDQIGARIRGEPLPPVTQATQGRGGQDSGGFGFGIVEIAILLFLLVPVISAVARGIFGRKLGALATGAGVGGVAFLVTASVWIAVVAGMVALLFALFSGMAAALPQARGRGGGWGGPVILPPSGGSWGGGGGGFGGFGSGGGGDFGGGGASGGW